MRHAETEEKTIHRDFVAPVIGFSFADAWEHSHLYNAYTYIIKILSTEYNNTILFMRVRTLRRRRKSLKERTEFNRRYLNFIN